MKRTTIVEIIAALFILLFFYTAISKTMDIRGTVSVLKKTPFLSGSASFLAWLIVGVEYLTTILLFFPQTRKIGLYSSLGLLSLFTLYIVYMMIFIPKLPCSCGGVISKLSWKQHLFFNIALIVISYLSIRILSKRQKPENSPGSTAEVVYT